MPNEIERETLPKCERFERLFRDWSALYSHIKAKHGRAAARPLRPREEREPSMGSLVPEATVARACGEPVEDWIAEVVDV